jgi:Ca-activated chloride channel family protein
MMEIKIEYNCLKADQKSALGLMFEVTAPESPADETQKAREPKGIVFVIDRSGSMGDGRLELVKQTIIDMIPRLEATDYLSVVSFDNEARVELPYLQLKDVRMADLRKRIGEIQPGGSTNLESGYLLGLRQVEKSAVKVETTLVLLSDGEANAGSIDPVELGRLAAKATEHLITTSTLGIGEGYDETILNAMSVSGGGNHFAAYRLAEAVDGLNDEFDGLLKKTVANLKIEIEAIGEFIDQDFQVRKVNYLREFKTFPGRATANLGDLASKEEKNFVFEVTLPGIKAAQAVKLEAIAVKYEYEDLVLGRKVTGGQRFELEVVPAADYVEPARNEDIVLELKALRFQDIKEQAIELMRQGLDLEARELIKNAGAEFQQLLHDLKNMSARNYNRMSTQFDEFNSMMMMNNRDEFMKRGTESVNRARRSKPDPRKDGEGR